jgi:hypothetical protein
MYCSWRVEGREISAGLLIVWSMSIGSEIGLYKSFPQLGAFLATYTGPAILVDMNA